MQAIPRTLDSVAGQIASGGELGTSRIPRTAGGGVRGSGTSRFWVCAAEVVPAQYPRRTGPSAIG